MGPSEDRGTVSRGGFPPAPPWRAPGRQIATGCPLATYLPMTQPTRKVMRGPPSAKLMAAFNGTFSPPADMV